MMSTKAHDFKAIVKHILQIFLLSMSIKDRDFKASEAYPTYLSLSMLIKTSVFRQVKHVLEIFLLSMLIKTDDF